MLKAWLLTGVTTLALTVGGCSAGPAQIPVSGVHGGGDGGSVNTLYYDAAGHAHFYN